MDFNSCIYTGKCKKYKENICPILNKDVEQFCIKWFKIDELQNLALLTDKQKQPIKMLLDKNKTDKKAFDRLKVIENDIVKFVNEGGNLYIYSPIVGNGKAQPDNSLILTPNGYITMRDIKAGDSIFGDDGNIYKVIQKFDRGVKKVYKITFSDGTTTESCDEHLWHVRAKGSNTWEDMELKYLINSPLKIASKSKWGGWKWYIPVCSPLKFSKNNLLKLSPYILGALLGDGCITKNSLTLTTFDDYIVNRFKNELPEFIEMKSNKKGSYILADTGSRKNLKGLKCESNKNRLKSILEEYNLLGCKSETKFIPKEYLYSNIEDRLNLLHGLMDTDGYICKEGNCYFTTVSAQLAEDIKFLVQSLGGTATLRKKTNRQYHYIYKKNGIDEIRPCKDTYNLSIKLPSKIAPCSLPRKLARVKNVLEPYRTIHNIEYIGEKHCYCIMTSNPSQLYLTDNCIVTHNTHWGVKLLRAYFEAIWYKTDIKCRGLFINVPKYFISLKDSFNVQSDYIDHIKANVLSADLVIWDDIATKGFTEFEMESLLNIINNRVDAGKANIYTSNLAGEDLKQAMGDRLYSRIANMSETIVFKSTDKRGILT